MIPASHLCFSNPDAYGDNVDDQEMDSRLLQSLRRIITSLISLPIKTATHAVFEKGCYLEQLLLFIDYRPDQQQQTYDDLNDIDITKIECNIDLLSINSWNEIICDSKQGRLLDTLLAIYMHAIQHHQIVAKTDLLCNHPDRFFQQKIRQALEFLFDGIFNFFSKSPSGRYISFINGRYLIIHAHEQRSTIKWLSTESGLKSLLTSPMNHYSPICFDKKTMSHHSLAIFAQQHKPESIQVFFQKRGEQADITLIDELGTWHESTVNFQQGQASLQPLHRFLRAISERRYDQSISDIGPFDIFPINFCEVVHAHEGLELERCSISSQVDSQAGLPIYGVADCIDGKYQFTLYLDEMRFSESDEGENMYNKLATFLKYKKSRNGSGNGYYINDLDLSKCAMQLSYTGELHTSHYLMMKKYLEEKINRAFKKPAI